MKGLKIFLIILFLIGVVFIIGTNLGSSHSNDQSVQTPAWLSNLGNRLVITQPLRLADLSATPASCVQQASFVVPEGTTCTFAINQSTFIQRVATVQLVLGAGASITLTQEKMLPVQETLTGTDATTDTNMKIYPGKAHGILEIQCLKVSDAPACLLKLT